MSKYSEYLKSRKEKDLEFFYGEIHHTSNKYFTFKRVHDEDNIVIITNNVKFIKGNPVLIVGSNKAVYLKEWAIRPVHNFYQDLDAYAVKLCRKYFKVYTFQSDFEDMSFDHDLTFDDLMEVAKAQDEENMAIASSHME